MKNFDGYTKEEYIARLNRAKETLENIMNEVKIKPRITAWVEITDLNIEIEYLNYVLSKF